ncbi:MAG: hypothetical protein OXG99_15780, partial [Alphaproteobacteria bacterium]|nr:hypothetical protein [Alphaproteobacteria bacterium]
HSTIVISWVKLVPSLFSSFVTVSSALTKCFVFCPQLLQKTHSILFSSLMGASRFPEREAADSVLKHHHVHPHQAGLYLPRFFRKGNQILHVNPFPGKARLFAGLCGLHHCHILSIRNERYRRLAEIDLLSQAAMDDQIARRLILQ